MRDESKPIGQQRPQHLLSVTRPSGLAWQIRQGRTRGRVDVEPIRVTPIGTAHDSVERERLRRPVRSRNQAAQGHVPRPESTARLEARAPLPTARDVLFDRGRVERCLADGFAALRSESNLTDRQHDQDENQSVQHQDDRVAAILTLTPTAHLRQAFIAATDAYCFTAMTTVTLV
jgi:hypothetical protein